MTAANDGNDQQQSAGSIRIPALCCADNSALMILVKAKYLKQFLSCEEETSILGTSYTDKQN
jgi:hypothetical protein